MRAKIFYFTLQDEQTKEEKLDWFERTKFEDIPFDHITPDQKANWINLTDNDFDTFLPLIDKEVKAGRSQKAVFQLFSAGVKTQRDEWVYDFSKDALTERMKYFVEVYSDRLENGVKRELDIKWDRELEKYLSRKIKKIFKQENICFSAYRPYVKYYFYFDRHFNGMTYQIPALFPNPNAQNPIIAVTNHTQIPFLIQAVDCIPEVAVGGRTGQCLPFYRYDKDGSRIDNITDWSLTQFQTHHNDPTITKLDIFHYTYAVLHHPAYRTKYERNLKREFPRSPFYADFDQWATWGKTLMDLHLNYGTIQPYGLKRQEIAAKEKPKAKLKADKTQGVIILDENIQLTGIPTIAWDYKLGNRSALEWILDQYKEKKPKDPTIAKLFNTYKFANYKEQVIDLLDRVCTVSVKTMEIIHQMPAE
ncbi:MAG: DNA methyltransferase [Phormidesmis sp. CAN_BIN44]|nr:DNA methyltransferase [Phormidesmis sp. CAN_BIN44]